MREEVTAAPEGMENIFIETKLTKQTFGDVVRKKSWDFSFLNNFSIVDVKNIAQKSFIVLIRIMELQF